MGITSSSLQQAKKAAEHRGYTIERKLGNGAFGDVYLASSFWGKVAIKSFKTKQTAFQEAETLQNLSSPYIVKMIDFYGHDIGGYFQSWKVYVLVMEFCPKGDLQTYLENHPKVDRKQRLTWYHELASGLSYLHSKDIAHRDIKPANILITANFQLKLGDVGLAKVAYDYKVNFSLDKDFSVENYYMNERAGTVPYVAPEIFARHYQKSSDLFSLGLVFVMIAAEPGPQYPLVKQDVPPGPQFPLVKQLEDVPPYLGLYLHRQRLMLPVFISYPVSLLDVDLQSVPEVEVSLFNAMLTFYYKMRPTANFVKDSLLYMLNPIPQRAHAVQPGLESGGGGCSCLCLCMFLVILVAVFVYYWPKS